MSSLIYSRFVKAIQDRDNVYNELIKKHEKMYDDFMAREKTFKLEFKNREVIWENRELFWQYEFKKLSNHCNILLTELRNREQFLQIEIQRLSAIITNLKCGKKTMVTTV